MRLIRSGPLVAAALTVATAGLAGLGRIGVLPVVSFGGASQWHGALMVTAIGTFIAVERATVIRRPWVWSAPGLAGLGALSLLAGAPIAVGGAVIALAAAIVVAVMARGAAATPGIAIGLMTAGAVAWLVSAVLLLLETPLVRVVPWWAAFLVLTIAGERHELARILRPSRAALIAFAFPVGVFVVGTALTLVDLRSGSFALGVGEVALAAWLLARDRPPAASRANPLSRFIARATRLAYIWLGVAGVLNVIVDVPAGLPYDAALHAVFAGFVLTMIFAHAPIVLPAMLGRAVAFRRAIYAPLAVLTVSVGVRILGDLVGREEGRAIGASGVGLAVALFAATMLWSVRSRRAESRAAVRAAGLR